MKYQVLTKDYEHSIWLHNCKDNIEVKENYLEIEKEKTLIIGGDLLRPEVRHFLDSKHPAIYIGRGYVGNHLHKTRKWWRYSINGWANTKILDIPYSRWDSLGLVTHPWKVKEIKNVLIAPSKMTSPIWDSSLGFDWANEISKKFPGAEIKIRKKGATPHIRWASLWDDLDWADLVVAQGSAITAEAFWYGKKVINTQPCITWAAEIPNLDDWQNPEEPKLRQLWHEHLAWSQFHNREWESGEALKLIDQYFGSIHDYDPEYTYSFSSSNIES